ncbi:MAG: HPr family phosphocarrier protein [Eubacteriales bacterium]|nr:HPr family phosphocarrier protein [Eubacteriales bacterium]
MLSIAVTVPFKEGLHARPATELVKICMGIKSDITLIHDEKLVNPKSILGIMSLGAGYGVSLTVQVAGVDEAEAIGKLQAFFTE